MPAGHIWIITGPAGSGKSTVAKFLADQLALPYIEGDEYHPQANIEKMSHSVPLTDADRWGWLEILRNKALQTISAGFAGAIVTCSALKRSYRDVIRNIPAQDKGVRVHFVYLKVPPDVLIARVHARQGHYMKDDMVRSQIELLEEPTPDEFDCLRIEVSGSAEQVSQAALDAVEKERRQ